MCVEDTLQKTWRTIKVGWEWSWRKGKPAMDLEGCLVTPKLPTSPSREGVIEGEERRVRGQNNELNFLPPSPLPSCPYLDLAKELEKW